MSFPAIILAAGASRRLGRPKQLVLVDGETLLARTIRVVRVAGAEPVLVVLGAHRERIEAEVDFTGVNVLVNADWGEGISSSIRVGIDGLTEISPDADGAMLLVCDQPRLTLEHLRKLAEGFASAMGARIVASEYSGVVGIPAVFPRGEFGKLLALRGDMGARLLLKNPEIALVRIPFDGGEADVDTVEDLVKL